MSRRLPVPPAPGPLETYTSAFDDLFSHRSQRDPFRRYLEGLLLPSERNKTFTGLDNTEPGVGATNPAAQRLQWFVTESTWEAERINQRRLRLLPPYSPELNPVERWFEALRAALSNQLFGTIEALAQTLTQALQPYWEHTERLAQLTGFGWWREAINNIRTPV